MREATVADAAAVAEVQVDGWRWGYAGLLPQAELDALDVADRTTRWASILAATGPARTTTFVALDAGGVCGFASIGPCREADSGAGGELYALYVRARVAGTGVGKALLRRAEAALRDAGHRDATLWVLGANARGRAFYERAGWAADGAEKREEGRCDGQIQARYRRTL